LDSALVYDLELKFYAGQGFQNIYFKKIRGSVYIRPRPAEKTFEPSYSFPQVLVKLSALQSINDVEGPVSHVPRWT